MKSKMLYSLAAGLLALLSGPALASEVRPFTTASLAEIREARAGEPFILALWSVNCPPCYAELAMLGEMRDTRPELPVVLVSTDAGLPTEELTWLLADYGLEDLDTWQFEGFPARLRHAVDSDWFGELPRSYFYDASHARKAHSGRLEASRVEGWLGE